LGEFLKGELLRLAQAHPGVIRAVRGLGLMIGIELAERETVAAFRGSEKTPAIQMVHRLHEAGVLTIPAGAQVIRLLPALNLTRGEAQEGLAIFERVLQGVTSG
jgi:4-aminobutyrate aminotransferase-like enzyme